MKEINEYGKRCILPELKAVLLVGGLVILLSGCAIADTMVAQMGDIPKGEYEKYTELRDKGQLNSEGNYIAPELEEPSSYEGLVHVTFASNANINVTYYSDPLFKSVIDPNDCYMEPGTCVYYNPDEVECHHPQSATYQLDQFFIYPYDETGNRGKRFSSLENDEPTIVLRIPESGSVSWFSVMPVGKYENQPLKVFAYYKDSAGVQQKADGIWTVNNKEIAEAGISVNPTEELNLDFQYDAQTYTFVAANQDYFYHDNGLVRFETSHAADDIGEYTVELRLRKGTFHFDPSEYIQEHGTVVFTYQGYLITEGRDIPDGGSIHYKANADRGYRNAMPEGEIKVNAQNESGTAKAIKDAIRFVENKFATVALPQPEYGGDIEYRDNAGNLLTGNSCSMLYGDTIKMKFTAWEHWYCKCKSEDRTAEYTVTEAPEQIVSVDGFADMNQGLFIELEENKPQLSFVVTDSAKNVTFGLTLPASGGGEQNAAGLKYADGNKTTFIPDWLGQKDRIVFDNKVGTYPAIGIVAKDYAVLDGKALKLEIVTKDNHGNEQKSIRYIADLPSKETIQLYDKNDAKNLSVVYENIWVTASVVDVVKYTAPTTSHGKITATLTDVTERVQLKEGDILEPDREVQITFTPADGYYAVGTNSKSGVYSETLKYSKWIKNQGKTMEKHPFQKLMYLTLDPADDYGTCIYKLDGTEVSGRISVREGQKLTLEYTITDPDYQIVRNGIGGFFGGLVHSEAETCDIPTSEDMDGKTIKRPDYITVERKGG